MREVEEAAAGLDAYISLRPLASLYLGCFLSGQAGQIWEWSQIIFTYTILIWGCNVRLHKK